MKTPDIDRSTFRSAASALRALIDGRELALEPREFSTGSYGWRASGPIEIEVDGRPVRAVLNLNLTVAHSKRG